MRHREKSFCVPPPVDFVRQTVLPFLGIILSVFCLSCARAIPREEGCSGYLHLALSEDPLTLDPAFITDVTGGALSAKIFDGLVRFDARGKIQPDIARSWKISQDGMFFEFTLRKDVMFHNGRKLTAEDVQKSFQRILDPAVGSPRRWVLDRIASIEVPGAGTLRICLKEPFAPFLSLLAMPNAAVVRMDENRQPVGTGPFILESWERDKRLVFKKNPRYFAGPPMVEGVEYRIIPESWAVLTEFMQGKLDWIAVGPAQLDQFLADPAMAGRLKSIQGLNTYYLGFQCTKPPWNNPRVRHALAMAIDREKIVQKLMGKRAIAAKGPIPPALDAALAGMPDLPYDPEAAKRILREEGIKDLSLDLYQASSLDTLEIMEVVQDYLAKVGVRVRIVQREWSSFKEAVLKGEPDMFFLSWWADYPDPENFLYPNFYSANGGIGGNKSRFADSLFDLWITQARSQEDSVKRNQLYSDCVRRVVDQCPWVFLWHRIDWVAVQPWVEGLELPLVYNGDKFTSVRLEPSR